MSNDPFRDNGGKLPTGLGIIRNATGKREHIAGIETWHKANPPTRPDSSYGARYAQRRYGR